MADTTRSPRTAPPMPSATMQPRRRSASQSAQDRRRALLLSFGMLAMAGLAAAMVLARTPNAPPVTGSIRDDDLRTARITIPSDNGECSQQLFDNQTGRVAKSSQPCEAMPTFDSTARRLDQISKSFSGQK